MTKKKDKRWIINKQNDYYYKLAKRENYRSRSTYKLFGLNKKLNLIKEKDTIIDLGCAPGGWMQAARKMTGEDGLIIGIDLLKIEPFKEKNVFAIKGDMREEKTLQEVSQILALKKIKKADVVICDASPNISGVWEVDHARSVSLTMTALLTATKVLKKGGSFIAKSFQGYLFDEYAKLVSEHFETMLVVKPLSCRRNSAEVYVIGKNFEGKEFQVNTESPIAELLDLKF